MEEGVEVSGFVVVLSGEFGGEIVLEFFGVEEGLDGGSSCEFFFLFSVSFLLLVPSFSLEEQQTSGQRGVGYFF